MPVIAMASAMSAPTSTSPESILGHLRNHLQVKYLMAGNRLGVFEALAQRSLDLGELAQATNLPVRTLRILSHALLTTGLLELHESRYRNGPAAAAFLAGRAGPDLRPLITMWDRVVELQWSGLVESLQSDQATLGWSRLNEEQQELFATGIEVITAPSAHALAHCYDFSQHQSLLDLAGGTGSFLLAALRRNPALRATLLERPAMASRVRGRLAAHGIAVIAADLSTDPIPAGFDAVLVANAIHLFSPLANQDLLRRIRSSAHGGTRLLLVDFWMDAERRTPEFGALLAGEFLIVSGGDVYSVDEVRKWLSLTGWRWIEHTPLTGAASLIVAEAAA